MLHEIFWIKKENDKSDTHIYLKKERKNIRKGISKAKIETTCYLYLTDLTGNNLF